MSEPTIKIGDTASVLVDGQVFVGTVYHVRDNGWACVETDTGHVASGPEAICCWFLLCLNEATGTRHHSILGDVPICDRCETKAADLDNDNERV